MHTKLERWLSKSLTTLEVMTYYLVVHTGPDTWKVTLLNWLWQKSVTSCSCEFNIVLPDALWAVLSLSLSCLSRDSVWYRSSNSESESQGRIITTFKRRQSSFTFFFFLIYLFFLKFPSLRRVLPPARTLRRPGRNWVQIRCTLIACILPCVTWCEGRTQVLSLTTLTSHLLMLMALTGATSGVDNLFAVALICLQHARLRYPGRNIPVTDWCISVKHSLCHHNPLLVVKASASRAEDPGFESRSRRDFSGVESYQ